MSILFAEFLEGKSTQSDAHVLGLDGEMRGRSDSDGAYIRDADINKRTEGDESTS